jgi:superfamily II DNA or RNA helicase
MNYKKFLKNKQIVDEKSGFKISKSELNPMLFNWQKVLVQWSLARGRAALFASTGNGKTAMQLEWAYQIHKKENKPILILAPLAVSRQTKNEGDKFNISVNVCKDNSDVINGINITNYEKLHKFDPRKFIGVVLDESSIIKNFASKTKNQVIDSFKKTKYRLACTATPSPNDYAELGNHAEFLGVMNRSEMLATFFINDTGDTGKWRIKGHVKDNVFWRWLASWSIMMTKPSDIGFSDEGFILPKIHYHQHIIPTKSKNKNSLLPELARTLNDRRKIRRETIKLRCEKAANLINKTNERWIAWCNLNDESSTLTKIIDDCEEVAGRHSNEVKSTRLLRFANGDLKRLVSKPKIAGFGLNMQICNNAVFVGLNDSFEEFFQACRRIWRFGQKKEVNIHIVIEEREGEVLKNIQRKEEQFQTMIDSMVEYMKEITKQELKSSKRKMIEYETNKKMELPKWII